jgi:hypothetical protein
VIGLMVALPPIEVGAIRFRRFRPRCAPDFGRSPGTLVPAETSLVRGLVKSE